MDSLSSLKNKTVVITCASSGLGRSISILVSQMNGREVMIARNEERLKETRNMLEGQNKVQRISNDGKVDDSLSNFAKSP